jgi:hypothetical protein
VEDVKSDLIPEEVAEARDAIKDFKAEAPYGAEHNTQRRR